MTIDELSRRTGVSTRNVRYYQTRGLLPPPTVKGRTGYYDKRHVERLALIHELQQEGLNLQAIGWLLGGAAGVDSDELRRLKRAVLDEWVTEAPVEQSAEDILEAFAPDDDADEDGADAEALTGRAQELGLLEPAADGTWSITAPTVYAAGRELRAMGVPPARMLDLLATLRRHAGAIAEAYVRLFDETVLASWDARGRPAEEWTEVRRSIERLRPLAGEALLAVFRQLMAEAVAARLAAALPDGEDAGAAAPTEAGPGSAGADAETRAR